MMIRFVRNWRHFREGQELDFADGMANVLKSRGIVVEVAQAPDGAQTLVPPSMVEVVQSALGTARKFGKRREA